MSIFSSIFENEKFQNFAFQKLGDILKDKDADFLVLARDKDGGISVTFYNDQEAAVVLKLNPEITPPLPIATDPNLNPEKEVTDGNL